MTVWRTTPFRDKGLQKRGRVKPCLSCIRKFLTFMNTWFASAIWRRRREIVRSAPPEIQLYCLFSVLVCSADLWLTFVGPQSIKAMTVPITSWSASMPYLFGLFPAFSLLFGSERPYRLRWGIVAPLLVYLVLGVIQYALPRSPDFGNPYLQINPWQPVWTMVLPVFWILLLLLAPVLRSRAVRV